MLESHIKDDVAKHLTLAMLKMGSMTDEINQLKNTISDMQTQQIDTLTKRVHGLQSDLLPIRNTALTLSGYLVITLSREVFISKMFNESMDSQPFEYGGYRWKIRVFPRGDRQDKEGYPSFYLWSEHNYEQLAVDIETRYTLSFENRNHQYDLVGNQPSGGVLGANFTFSKRIGNGWSLKNMNENFTTEYMSDKKNGFVHEEDDCLHIRACILDIKQHSRTKRSMTF
jgi:hypothetical protein